MGLEYDPMRQDVSAQEVNSTLHIVDPKTESLLTNHLDAMDRTRDVMEKFEKLMGKK